MTLKSLSLCLTAAAISCVAGGPKNVDVDPVSKGNKNWCTLQDALLKSENMKCSALAGRIEHTSFGRIGKTKRRLEDCLITGLTETFGYRTASAQVPAYEEDWSSEFGASGGLFLEQVSPWLPRAGVDGKKGSKLRVKVEIAKAQFVRISDPSLVFRRLLGNNALTRAQRDSIQSCVDILCSEDCNVVTEVLIGVPSVTFTSNEVLEFKEQLGWKILNVNSNLDAHQNFSITVGPADPNAPPVVMAATEMPSAAQMVQDKLCGAAMRVDR